jgi:hypothetical protein
LFENQCPRREGPNDLSGDRFTAMIAKTAPTAPFFRMDENS